MTRFPACVATRLKQAREALQLTQEQLADQSGVNKAMISHCETGLLSDTRSEPYLPSLATLRRLAIALDVSIDWIVGLTNKSQVK